MRALTPLRWLVFCLVLATLTVTSQRLAHADQVARLSQILLGDSSARVRMQAAIILGRLRKLAAVPALMTGLRDDNANVRKVSAAALGQIGDRTAAPSLLRALRDRNDGVKAAAATALATIGEKAALAPLRKLLKRSKSRLVRDHARRAVARLKRSPSGAVGASRIVVTLGKVGNKTDIGGRALSEALSRALLRQFRRAPGVSTIGRSEVPAAGEIRRRQLKVFVLDGAIVDLSHKRQADQVELSCSIRVSLATFPQNSMKAFYNGAAAMAVGAGSFRPATAVQLYRELIEGAAQEARKHIVQSYLRYQ